MFTGKPLLVVEDSDQDFMVLEMCLRSAGVHNQLDRCASGEDVAAYLDRMETARTTELPVFIFLDLNLPGTRGLTVLDRLKNHPTLHSVPIVVLTTSTQPQDVDMSYSLGAAGFLTKPLDLDKFEKMIQQVADYWFSCVRLPENAKRVI